MDRETWFEVKIDSDLAATFQRIINVYNRIGKRKRAALLRRISLVIPESEKE